MDSSDTRTPTRRDILRLGGVGLAAALAGCGEVGEDNPAYDVPLPRIFGGRGGATVPGGQIPARQEFGPGDARSVATTPGELRSQISASDGRVIWIPNDAEIDMTGQDLTLENVIVASGRADGTLGGAIRTEDEGSSSTTWDGGSNHRGLIELQDNARLSGVRILGPHHSEVDHPAFGGYIPFMEGPTKSARDAKRSAKYARGISVTGDQVTIDNCEIAYFSVQAIAIGTTADTPENTVISYTHTHNCAMESLGYGLDVRHGDPLVYRCFMDKHRHAVNGSGMADSNYKVIETTFGPWTAGHVTDQHAVKDNVSGSSSRSARDYRHRAGGRMLVRGCRFMTSRTPDLPFLRYSGNPTPHATIRAVPEDGFYFENNICSHDSISSAIEQRGVPGSYPRDENGFTRVYVSNNTWGASFDATNQVP